MRTTGLLFVLPAAALWGTLGCTGQVAGTPSAGGGSGGSAVAGTGGAMPGSGGGSGGAGQGPGQGGGGTGGAGGAAGSVGPGTTCKPLAPIQRRLWRLSAQQWSNAVRDLLALPSAPAITDTGGANEYAFFADTTLGITPEFQYALYDTTERVVLPAIASRIGVTPGGASGAIAPCSGTTATAQTTCAQTFLQAFAKKAFRRPVDAGELTNLMAVYTQGAMQDYATGISLALQAVLLSPSFVYRTELGPVTLAADASGLVPDTALTPYEIATQLAFLFLGSTPDDALLAAADKGSLATTAGLNEQLDRLLASPQVQANLTNILVDWFNVRQMFSKTKDTSLFAALPTADQDQAMLENDIYLSTQKFVNEVFWTNPSGTVDDLLSSQSVWVNKRLATLYPGLTFSGGAPTSNTTFVRATWPAGQGRAGMLTQPGFLWAASDPAETSIVKRGRFIHDDVLCQDALAMAIDLTTPAAMNVINCKSPDGTMTLSACNSEVLKSDARMSTQPCMACHAQMDPYARVLLNFGPIGNYRTMDEAGHAIDPTVTFAGSSPLAPRMATGAQAFAQQLTQSGVLRGCAVQKVASYAIGDAIRTYDTCELNGLRGQTDGTIGSLFKGVATATFLRARKGGAK